MIVSRRGPMRVQPLHQRQHVIGVGVGTDLHADRVGDPGREVDMRTVRVAASAPHPQEVTRRAHQLPRERIGAHQRPLVVQRQRLMRHEELDAAELLGTRRKHS